MKINQNVTILLLLILATGLEVCGDALVRKCIHEYTGAYRIGAAVIGAVLLFGYGFSLNMAPIEFGKVVGLYIATLFVMWQVISYFTFKSVPSAPVLVGGVLIVLGGLIVSFWPQP